MSTNREYEEAMHPSASLAPEDERARELAILKGVERLNTLHQAGLI